MGLGKERLNQVGYGFLWFEEFIPMTNRVSYAPQDFQKMCKQAERDQETKKLVFLMDRLKKQIKERGLTTEISKLGPAPVGSDSEVARLPIRSVPLER